MLKMVMTCPNVAYYTICFGWNSEMKKSIAGIVVGSMQKTGKSNQIIVLVLIDQIEQLRRSIEFYLFTFKN